MNLLGIAEISEFHQRNRVFRVLKRRHAAVHESRWQVAWYYELIAGPTIGDAAFKEYLLGHFRDYIHLPANRGVRRLLRANSTDEISYKRFALKPSRGFVQYLPAARKLREQGSHPTKLVVTVDG